MEKKLYITFSDSMGLTQVEIDDSGITSDGTYLFFTDASERDYKIPAVNVYSVTLEWREA